jgi:TPR repeat protein
MFGAFMSSGLPQGLVMKGHAERDYNKNYAAAAKYYQEAADKGSAEGLLNLVFTTNA